MRDKYILQIEKDLKEKQEVKLTKRIVIRWFMTIILCVLVQLLFYFISEYFTSFSKTVLLFGGWASCIVYYTRTHIVT